MKNLKVLSLTIGLLMIISGLSVITQTSQGQTQPDTVTFRVKVDRKEALTSLAEGDSDIFMKSLDHRVYDNMDQAVKDELDYWKASGGYKNYFFNRAWEGPNTTAMQNAIDEDWIAEENRNGPLYEANNELGEWEFNPFAVQEIRYAMNHLVDRQGYLDEFKDGFGEPRFVWEARRTAVYQDKFQEMVESGDPDPTDGDFGMTPDGNQEWAANYINETLMEIAHATDNSTNHFQMDDKNITFMGNLRPPIEGNSGYWEYTHPSFDEWRVVEVTGAIREEDWRLDMGQDFANQLRNQVNIQVEELLGNSHTLLTPLIFSADPHPWDDVAWHFYTGAWLANDNRYHPHVNLRQMYAPAPGWTLSRDRVDEGRWHYGMTEEGQRLNDLTYEPYAGHVESKEEYWNYVKDAVEVAVQDSVRVFTVTETNLYTYDKDSINSVVTNAVTGWDQVFGPRTLDTDKDHLNVDYYSSGALLEDHWNWYGGSKKDHINNERKWVLGFQSWRNPHNGKPMEMGSTWNVETDYTYDDTGVLQKNLEIPSSAMEYEPHNESWETVEDYYDGEVPDVATKATISVNEGSWHDGTEHGLHTIAEYYGRLKNMVYQNDHNNNTDYYYDSHANQVRSWWENVKAIEFHPDSDNYTIYGNCTFPDEDKIGQYYTIEPRTSQAVYEAVSQDVYETQYSANPDTTFGWSKGEGNITIDLMGKGQAEDYYIPTMQKMIKEDFVPPQVNESQPLDDSLTFNAIEYAEKLQAAIDFYNENNNLFISYGPYYFSDNRPDSSELELTRFEGYTEYFDWHHWKRPTTKEIKLFDLQTPRKVIIGNDFEVSVQAYIEEYFPAVETYPIGEEEELDVEVLTLYLEGKAIRDITSLSREVGEAETTFSAEIPTEGLEEGNYTVEMKLSLSDSPQEVTVKESLFLEGYDLYVNTMGQGEVKIEPDKETYEEGEHVTLTVEPADRWKFKEWAGDHEGEDATAIVTMDSDKHFTAVFDEITENGEDDNVDGDGENDTSDGDEDTPGFSMMLLLISALIAVVVYQKKQR